VLRIGERFRFQGDLIPAFSPVVLNLHSLGEMMSPYLK